MLVLNNLPSDLSVIFYPINTLIGDNNDNITLTGSDAVNFTNFIEKSGFGEKIGINKAFELINLSNGEIGIQKNMTSAGHVFFNNPFISHDCLDLGEKDNCTWISFLLRLKKFKKLVSSYNESSSVIIDTQSMKDWDKEEIRFVGVWIKTNFININC